MTDRCDLVLDLSGMHCPYSLLELNAAFKDMRPGATAEILGDRASLADEVRRWCESTGNLLLSSEVGGAAGAPFRFKVKKA